MEYLLDEHAGEYYTVLDDEIHSIIRRGKWEIVSRNLVPDHNVLPGTWHFKCKRKPE